MAGAVQIPVRVTGVRVDYSPEQFAPLGKLDSFFLQATSSENETYTFVSGMSSLLRPHAMFLANPVASAGRPWKYQEEQ